MNGPRYLFWNFVTYSRECIEQPEADWTTHHVTSVRADIRVFCSFKQRRGWPGQARPRHKGNGQPLRRLV
jgi:hypothetical protein